MNSKGEIRRSIVDLNPLIVCTLCQGYFIDPVTLVECLHSFCKTCIMKHVEKSEVCCPICDTLIHKTKPFSSMREDKTLQDIVYKIVPGLHHNEMLRRKKFYATHPSKGKVPDLLERELRNKIFFNQEDKFSISIQYFDPSMIKKEAAASTGDRTNPNKRYLECPGPMQVCHLKKFIAMKYGLNLESFMIDIIYKDDLIPNHYTLIDIAYNYNWKKDHPMQFFYRIFKKSKVLLKRKRKTSRVEEKCNDGSHIQVTEATSPKKCKSDPGDVKSPRSTNGSLGPEKLPSSNDLSPQKETSVANKKIKSSVPTSSSGSTKTSTTAALTNSSPSSHHKVVKAALSSTSKSVSASSNREKVSSQSKDSLPKIIVTSKQPSQKESLKVVSTPASVSQVTSSPLTSIAKGGSSNGATLSPGRDRPTTTGGGTTIQTSIISKEDKNGKTLIIRKSPISSSSVKLPNSSPSLNTSSKVSVNSDGTKSVLKKVPQVSASTTPRPILPKSDKVMDDGPAKKEGDKKSHSAIVPPPVPSSDVNGNSEVTKVVSNNNNSANSQSSHHPKSTPNSQNNLSNIVKSLTAKKKLEDSQSSSSSTTSKASQSTSSSKPDSKMMEKSNTSSSAAEPKSVVEKPASPPKIPQQEKSESSKKDANKATTVTTNSVIEKKSNNNASAEAIAQSIIANYAIAAAAQQAAAVNAHQVLTNQLSLSRGAYPGAYEHLLRPPYVKVTDPSLKMPMMSNSNNNNNNSSSSSSSSPTAGGAGNGSQIPNTNRLQFKVQASPSNANLTSIFSNTKQLPTDIKSLFGASVKKFNSNVPKALNQSIRQIPNPSLLTNKGNNSMQKK